MKSKSLTSLLAAGLFLLPTLSAQAAVDSILQLDLRCYFQEKFASSGDRESGKVGIVRIDSKQLLALLAKQTGVRYKGGSRLKIAVDGSVHVADGNGTPLGDVSQYLSADSDLANSLFNGKRNLGNGEEKSRNYYPITFNINLPSLKGKIQGVLIEDFTVSPATRTGVQFTAAKSNSDISGKGSVSGKLAYFEGNLNLQGREAVIVR